MSGERIRLHRILGPGRTLMLPLDDGLISGPSGWLSRPRQLLSIDLLSSIDSVLCFPGIVRACEEQLAATPIVVNLSASTTLSRHTEKRLIGRVEDAVAIGADAICYHINVTAPHEGRMLSEAGQLIGQARRLGVPVMLICYPRRPLTDDVGDENYRDRSRFDEEAFTRLVTRSVRIGVELGASIIKTVYTGSVESFREVVRSAVGVPIIAGGGPPSSEDDGDRQAQCAVQAGATGVAYGRWLFRSDDPVAFARRLRVTLDAPT